MAKRHYCGGPMFDIVSRFNIGERDGEIIELLVPSTICPTCGDTMLAAVDLDQLDAIRAGAPYDGYVVARRTSPSTGFPPVTSDHN